MPAISQNVRSFLFSLPSSVKLLAAVKGRSAGEIADAAAAGVRIIGENIIQEAHAHFSHPSFPRGVEKHFIGHLQSNKSREAVKLFDVIETVDSVKLAKKLDTLAGEAGKTQRIFLEVKISGEDTKFGFAPEELLSSFKAISKLPHLKVEGLMGMAPMGKDARPYFKKLRALSDSLGLKECSMGMSDDWKEAAEEGATIVRIGEGIFGERA